MLPRTVLLAEQAGATRIIYAKLEGRYRKLRGYQLDKISYAWPGHYRDIVGTVTVELLT